MSVYRGIDTCAPISASAARKIAEDGFAFVGRYLVPESGTTRWKALTRAEAERICAAGLRILCVWETTADRVKGGAAAGKADGAAAAKLARKLGLPDGAVLYFAVDYNARSTADYKAIRAYLTAARAQTGLWEIGVYGSFRVVETMMGSAPIRAAWQCVAWSDGIWSNAAAVCQTLWQYAPECRALADRYGFAVDLNDCEDMDAAGMWTYNKEEEDIMTDREIYEACQRYAGSQPLPKWAQDELREAQELGITDGTRPMELVPRYQAAIMAMRAVKAAVSELGAMDDRAVSGLLSDD